MYKGEKNNINILVCVPYKAIAYIFLESLAWFM